MPLFGASSAATLQRMGRQEDNISRVRQGYELFLSGNLDEAMEMFDAEIVVEDRVDSPDAATFYGPDGFQKYLVTWLEPWEEFSLEPEAYHATDTEVVAFIRQWGRVRGISACVEEKLAHVWTVREDKAIRYRVFTNREEALLAVGLGRRWTMAEPAVRAA
jgi:ketosteroid isomerase-like protein